jgi:hypothetical protein
MNPDLELPPVTRRRRSLITVMSASALVIAGGAATLLATSTTATAASSADLSLVQTISGSSTSGETVDTIRVHNAGSATANHINISVFTKSTSNFILTASHSGTCETGPPPPGYLGMTNCQLGSLAKGGTVSEVLTFTGQVGVAFSNFAGVGDASPSDPNLKNNSSTVNSWFGPRADLALSGTAKTGTKHGTAKAVTTILNRGPNNASALQAIVEIKSAGFQGVTVSGTPLSSCQIIPPSSGNDSAVSCVTDSLATHKKWILTFHYSGANGATLRMKTTTSANNPADPATANNTMTRTTHLKS